MKVKICTLKSVTEVFPEIDFRAFEAARLLAGEDYEVKIKVNRYEYPLTCSNRDFYVENQGKECVCCLYDPESDSPQQTRTFPKSWLKNFREVDNGKLSEQEETKIVMEQILEAIKNEKMKKYFDEKIGNQKYFNDLVDAIEKYKNE